MWAFGVESESVRDVQAEIESRLNLCRQTVKKKGKRRGAKAQEKGQNIGELTTRFFGLTETERAVTAECAIT